MRRLLRVIYPAIYPEVSNKCKVPFPPLAVNNDCEFPGLMVEIIDLIAHQLNMEIVPIVLGDPFDSKEFDIREAYKLINNGSADTVAASFRYTEKRAEEFLFSDTIFNVRFGFIMKQTLDVYNSIWSFLTIFDFWTWMSFFGVLLIQIALCVQIKRSEAHRNKKLPFGIFESIWQTLRMQLFQPGDVDFESKAGKIFFVSFSLIQCTVLLGVFSNWILSKILITNYPVPVKSMEQFIDKIRSREYNFIGTDNGGWFNEEIENSYNFPFVELNSALKNNPFRAVDSPLDTLRKIKQGNFIAFVQDNYEINYRYMETCGISKLWMNDAIKDAHLIFAKNSTILKDVNRAINLNLMKIAQITRKYLGVLLNMNHPTDCIKGISPIGLIPYYGVLIICSIILLIAIFIFVAEFVTNRYCNRRVLSC